MGKMLRKLEEPKNGKTGIDQEITKIGIDQRNTKIKDMKNRSAERKKLRILPLARVATRPRVSVCQVPMLCPLAKQDELWSLAESEVAPAKVNAENDDVQSLV